MDPRVVESAKPVQPAHLCLRERGRTGVVFGHDISLLKKKRNLHVLAAKLRSAVRLREVVVTCPANRAVTTTPSLWGV